MLLLLLAFCALAECAEVQVRIAPAWDGAPLLLDSLRYPLRDGTVSVTRLSALLGGFALERSEGGWVELAGQFAWLDAARRRTGESLRDVPPGEYRALRFAVGLDPATNTGDPARWAAEHPLNPNLNGLHWTWQGGYIFLALEGHFRTGDSAPRGYSYHFARDANRTLVTLPVALRLAADGSARIGVSFDVGALFKAPRAISPSHDGDSTHSREGDPLADALRANLASAFQVREVVAASAAPLPTVMPLEMPAHFTPYRVTFSAKFPIPALPRDNPLIVERVELGRRLFHEPLLSRTGTQSCATCHDFTHAFADPRRFSLGVDGQVGTRNAMPLFNLAWKSSFFWDGRAPSLRVQALMPIQDHTEMDEQLDRVVAKLGKDYAADFARAFDTPEITPGRIGLAIENFLLTLVSSDSKFDRAMRGAGELSAEERRGFELFSTEYEPRTGQRGADCFHCHGGALFTDNQFHNNGVDMAKFATPSLRNVALTAPYMHDGRFATLAEVIEHYDHAIVRSATLDPNLAKHPVGGLGLSDADKKALIAFLESLTDPQYR
ncbi:MAG: MbnP family protein [Chthoniobacteraceae bacterium]